MNLVAKLNQRCDEMAHSGCSPLVAETARAIMQGYLHRWEKEDAKVRVRGIETPFCVQIPVPEDLHPDARPKQPRYVGGIIDSLIEVDGVLYATDMKTTSRLSEAYWQELSTNPQLTQYAFALYASGFERVGFFWDVIVKPGIEPKALTKAAVAELEQGTYCGWPVQEGVPEDGRECPSLYQLRLLNWYMDNPQKYERRYADRNEAELLQYVYNEHCTQAEMEICSLRGGDPSWSHKNFCACYSWGKLCDYHPVCRGTDPEMLGFKPREKREGVADLGVTPSQNRCFNHCRQHWLYRYVQRIEPVVKQKSDALELGTACHELREVILEARLEDPIVLPLELGDSNDGIA